MDSSDAQKHTEDQVPLDEVSDSKWNLVKEAVKFPLPPLLTGWWHTPAEDGENFLWREDI